MTMTTLDTLITTLSQPAFIIWLLKATLLLVAALAATSLLRRASAGTRHLVWLGALAGILVLPALSFWTPVQLAVLPTSLTRAAAREIGLPQSPAAAPSHEAASDAAAGTRATLDGPSIQASAPSAAATPNEPRIPVWSVLLVAWGVAAAALLAWLALGALSVRRIVRSGRTLDERAWTAPLCEIADRLDLDAVPRLLSSPRIEMPFACGVLQPTIVLPASAEEWNDSRRRAVLFHELAHVKRHDLIGHTLGRLACAFYWFHPLVWTAARRLRAESERACDDLVLSCGARASDYADHLLDIVISVRRYGAPATAMPMARRRELEGRVLAILDPAVRRIGPGRAQSAGLVATLGLLAMCVAAIAPAKPAARAAEREAAGPESPKDGARPAPPNEPARRPAPTYPAPKTRAVVTTPVGVSASVPQAVPSRGDASFSATIGTLTGAAVRAAAQALAGGAKKTGSPELDSAKVMLLLKVLRTDPDESVRRMAAWGLNEATGMAAVTDALVDAVRHDDSGEVREMAAWALADSHRETARRALADALRKDSSDEVRETAAWALGNSDSDDERDALEAALASDQSAEVRETAAWGLGYSARRPAARALVTALGDKSSEVRETAAWALAETEDEDTAPAIIQAFLKETSGEVRAAELRALTFLHVENRDVLDAALASKNTELRAQAVRMLAGGGGSWPQPRPRPRPRPMP
jgi:beta-lactamase regulating signal transducer with metallopeptidase domain/HEAT repeat protein